MGKVFLVGAGPGDPELLTLKAARLLAAADVVLHDALVSQPILDLVRSGAKVIDIGKRCGHKLLTQQEINALLVFYGSTAGNVIRLKGGDPSIFGRAGEEIEALAEAGVPFEIVPGITSALAAAAASRVSLTDRRFAASVVFTTAHRAPGANAEWHKLVTSGSTLAIYMPGNDYIQLSADLRAAGLHPHTPCTVVSAAGRPEQQVLWTNLTAISHSPALPAPSLVIMGRCAGAAVQTDSTLKVADEEHSNGTSEQSLMT
ncbi:MAG: uroporphyrinogen-III C-methyltransferase [Terriglobales bacterium]